MGFPEQPLQEMQKQEQTPQDPRFDMIGGTNDNIGQKPVQVVVKGGGASKNSGSDWMISIRGKLKQAREDDANSWSELCIYKVPQSLRNVDFKAFVPLNVSLGPYHHDKKCLRQMDRHKWRFLRRVLKRTNQDITVYLDSVREVEEAARSCYEGPIPLSSNEFVEMMVLDGCFVLELFRGVSEGFETLGYAINDPIFSRLGSMDSIQRDMILLENQLPLFILDRLLKLQLGCDFQKDVAELAVTFFDNLMPTFLRKKTFDPPSDARQHCLEIFRRSLMGGSEPDALLYRPRPRPSPNSDVAEKGRHHVIHFSTELKYSAIKFKEMEIGQFFDIKFKNGVLWIPRLLIDDRTESLFLNLMAFEQCHFDCSNYINSYVSFMDNLINSSMDVAHLHSCGIIKHRLGSDSEVVDLFNRLGCGVLLDIRDNYLSQVAADVNEYHNRRRNVWKASWKARCNVWKATFKHKYFNSPWAIISLIAGFVLLLLTFLQTLYGVYAYYRPSS